MRLSGVRFGEIRPLEEPVKYRVGQGDVISLSVALTDADLQDASEIVGQNGQLTLRSSPLDWVFSVRRDDETLDLETPLRLQQARNLVMKIVERCHLLRPQISLEDADLLHRGFIKFEYMMTNRFEPFH